MSSFSPSPTDPTSIAERSMPAHSSNGSDKMPPPLSPASSSKDSDTRDSINFAFLKGPKRKRLAKACDACHKSKRRCDGMAPCSNCYFASKGCTYTDASGNPVPAPHADRDRSAEPHRRRANAHHPPVPAAAKGVASYNASDTSSDEYNDRKRFRFEENQPPDPPFIPRPFSTFPTSRLDPCVVRELVNLFFAHCHPQRFIIHKPTFCAALSHGRIPCSLLYAMCAMAAPLSKQPAVRTSPPRTAGHSYAQEAIKELFDKSGRLSSEPNLVTAQALCILQSHEILTAWPWTASTKYQDIALKILEEDLHVHSQNNPVLTPVPTPEMIFTSIDRECTRRAFWLLRFLSLTSNLYYDWPMPQKQMDLTVRLPVDETSFEMSTHSTLSEYLHVPAPRTQWVSEIGHLLRVCTIYATLEGILRGSEAGTGPADRAAIEVAVQDTEQALSTWEASLADHVKFTDESLQLQLSMFETSSNAGAWCYFLMHIMHASCLLSLSDARSQIQVPPPSQPSGASTSKTYQAARERIMGIVTSLGSRAKNNLLLVAALVPLYKHGLGDHPQIAIWTKEFEDMWGTKLPMLFNTSRSPPQPQRRPSSFTVPALPYVNTNDTTTIHDDAANALEIEIGRPYRSLRQFSDSVTKAGAGALPKLEASSPVIPAAGRSPTLPSLKACGLLDPSWLPPAPLNAFASVQKAGALPASPWAARRSPSEAPSAASGSSEGQSKMNVGMPVGLGWLQHE